MSFYDKDGPKRRTANYSSKDWKGEAEYWHTAYSNILREDEREVLELREEVRRLREESAMMLHALNVKESERRMHRDLIQAWANSYAFNVDGTERDTTLWTACIDKLQLRVPLGGRR